MHAQPTIKVSVSADTIEVGQTVDISYSIENGDGQFVLPDLEDVPVISGPNSSTSFVYAQGKTTSSQSYSFTLLGLEEGKIKIPKTVYKSGKELIDIKPIEIVVRENGASPSGQKKSKETTTPAVAREKRKF